MGLGRVAALCCLACVGAGAQATQDSPVPGAGPDKAAQVAVAEAPLPNMDELIARARARQNTVEGLRAAYTYKETLTGDEFDSHGNKKGTHSDEYQVWTVKDVTLQQHLAHDGKPLSPDQQAKEQQRIDKEIASIKDGTHKTPKESFSISVSNLMKVVVFSNERRVDVNGRPTIVFDYRGNPSAKATDLGLEIMKKLTGQVWVDEQDAAIARMQGALAENFHVAGGLLVNVKAGSSFDLLTQHINGEIWFPQTLSAHVNGRILLLKGFDGDARLVFADYRKMKTSATILPGEREVDTNGNPVAEPASPGAHPQPQNPQP